MFDKQRTWFKDNNHHILESKSNMHRLLYCPLCQKYIYNIVTCPFHGAKFDVSSGKKLSEPILTPSQEMEPLPKTWQKYLEHAGQLMSHIKTYDQHTYETKVEGTTIKVKI